MRFFELYTKELFATGLVFITVILLRVIVSKAIRKYSKSHTGIEKRTNLVIKYIHLLINILATISLIVIGGVQKNDIMITLSSIAIFLASDNLIFPRLSVFSPSSITLISRSCSACLASSHKFTFWIN